jgi:hypothetical protein
MSKRPNHLSRYHGLLEERESCAHLLLKPKSEVKSLTESRLFQCMYIQHSRQRFNGRSALTLPLWRSLFAIQSVKMCLFLHLHTPLLARERSHFSQLGASRSRVLTMYNLSNVLPPCTCQNQDLMSSPTRRPHRPMHEMKRISLCMDILYPRIRSNPRIRIRSNQTKQFAQFVIQAQTIRSIRHLHRKHQAIRSQALRARHRMRLFH